MENDSHEVNGHGVHGGNVSVDRVVSNLSGAKGIEPAESAEDSGFFGELIVDQSNDGPQNNEPCFLNGVHDLIF